MSTSWIFNVNDQKISLQPNQSYRNKIVIFILVAISCIVLAYFFRLNTEIYRLLISIGVFCTAYALYDFVFRFKLTYIFDLKQRKVYQKVPGLFSRKLMNFDEVHILLETDNCEPHYVLSNQKDRYGKNYAISDYFSGRRKGIEEQHRYETEVLVKIGEVIYSNPKMT